MRKQYIIGIDEVGRGCLAGPVTVAAVAATVNSKLKVQNPKLKLKDSKKLTSAQREEWLRYIKEHPKIFYAVAHVRPSVIDKINITQAANLAASRALARVCKLINYDLRSAVSELRGIKVFLDGGLYLKLNSLTQKLINSKTVIRGDEKFNCIRLASIVAKVRRDNLMRRWHKKFPHYGFDEHVGYGTKKHIAAIKRRGQSKLHRLTFIKNFVRIPRYAR